MYSVSKQLLKLAITMTNQVELRESFEKAILQIQTACQAEQDILFEIVGGSIGKIVIDDEVRYASEYYRTKTAQMGNNPMIVN